MVCRLTDIELLLSTCGELHNDKFPLTDVFITQFTSLIATHLFALTFK